MKLPLNDLKKLGKMQKKFLQIEQMYLEMRMHLPMMSLWESKAAMICVNISLEKYYIFVLSLNRYKAAKRDNDSVYFEKVPTLSNLPAIQGMSSDRIDEEKEYFNSHFQRSNCC